MTDTELFITIGVAFTIGLLIGLAATKAIISFNKKG